jgi:hypothetical protein
VTRARPSSTSVLLWFGLFGPPAAWTVQHITGYALTEATCGAAGRSGWDVHLHAWTIVVSATALAITLAGGAAAVLTFLRTRDAGEEPPASRVHFLSVVAMTTTPLFAAIILMSSLGSLLLTPCVQS